MGVNLGGLISQSIRTAQLFNINITGPFQHQGGSVEFIKHQKQNTKQRLKKPAFLNFYYIF
jgi:hypothetical protein